MRPSPAPPPLRMAVFGAGGMGYNHIRLLQALPDVALVAVCDPDPAACLRATGLTPAPTFADAETLLDHVALDAASVVVPTSLHYPLVLRLLSQGVDVLVEKPIAGTSAEGRLLVAAAAQHGRVLSVGHVERFNPAVRALAQHLDQGAAGQIFQIKARRTGPFPVRIRDVGVVRDLATHDLDLILQLSGSEPLRIYAETERNIHTDHEDMLLALLRMVNGTAAHLDINWLSPYKTRELVVVGERGSFVADALRRQLCFYANGLEPDMGGPSGMTEGQVVHYPLPDVEPLRAELEAFVAAVRGEQPVAVSGADGVRALAVAEAVLQSAATRQVISYRPFLGDAADNPIEQAAMVLD